MSSLPFFLPNNTAYLDYGGCDFGGFYGECNYGGCEYGECDPNP